MIRNAFSVVVRVTVGGSLIHERDSNGGGGQSGGGALGIRWWWHWWWSFAVVVVAMVVAVRQWVVTSGGYTRSRQYQIISEWSMWGHSV